MRDYAKPRVATYDELYLKACQQMMDWINSRGGKPNTGFWFYKQLERNIEHYGKLAGVSVRA